MAFQYRSHCTIDDNIMGELDPVLTQRRLLQNEHFNNTMLIHTRDRQLTHQLITAISQILQGHTLRPTQTTQIGGD